MKYNTVKGYLLAIASAIIFGCMPLMAKHIYTDGVNSISLVFWRNFFSLIPLAILAYKEQGTLKIPVKLLPSVSLIAILGCCATPILLFSSYNYIASGTATIFHFIYPAVVVLSETVLLKSKPQIGNIIGVILCVTGICYFYDPGEPLSLTGSSLALLSGFTFAAYVILLARFKKHGISGFLSCFYVVAISTIVALIVCVSANSLTFPASRLGWGLCVLFSLLVSTGAVAMFQKSAFLIGSERASILSTLEPITGVVVGVIVFGEPLGLNSVIGSILVIAASLLIAFFDLRKNTVQQKGVLQNT